MYVVAAHHSMISTLRLLAEHMDALHIPLAKPLQTNDSVFCLFVVIFFIGLSALFVFSIYDCEVCFLSPGSRVKSAQLS